MAINFQAQLDFKTKVVQSKGLFDYNAMVGRGLLTSSFIRKVKNFQPII